MSTISMSPVGEDTADDVVGKVLRRVEVARVSLWSHALADIDIYSPIGSLDGEKITRSPCAG